MKNFYKLLLLIMMPVLFGCSSSNNIRYYSLDSDTYFIGAECGKNDNLLLVKRVKIPEYLNTKSIVYRVNEHEVIYTNQNRWVDDLEYLVNVSLVKNLRSNLKSWCIMPHSEVIENKKSGELQISLNNFEVIKSSIAVVDYDYRFNFNNEQLIGTIHVEENLSNNDYEAVVAALNKAWQKSVKDMLGRIMK
jgi:uncharacterized lipoprotein YmbA